MKMNHARKQLLASFLLLSFVSSCGDDIASSRANRPLPGGPSTPEVLPQASGQRSQIPREKGSPVLSYAEEIQKTLAGSLPVNLYRLVPEQEKDDESASLTVQSLGRPLVDCGGGTSFATITARIADCVQKNSDRATWDGTRFGVAGDGNWNLVAKTEAGEFWLDSLTKLIWSPILTPTNWCRASGNAQGIGAGATVDCQTGAGGTPSCDDGALDVVGTSVRWRIPTRNDFLQADLNGLRSVLVKEADGTGLWTGTVRSSSTDRREAWVYQSKEGILTSDAMTATKPLRCIGSGPL